MSDDNFKTTFEFDDRDFSPGDFIAAGVGGIRTHLLTMLDELLTEGQEEIDVRAFMEYLLTLDIKIQCKGPVDE